MRNKTSDKNLIITLVDVFSSFLSSNALTTDPCVVCSYITILHPWLPNMRCLEHLHLEKVYFVKSVVSLTYDWMDWTIGCR